MDHDTKQALSGFGDVAVVREENYLHLLAQLGQHAESTRKSRLIHCDEQLVGKEVPASGRRT